MAERSFVAEIEDLRKGEGDVFTGEGILAITKALLECGVGYVGGYQGAPISHPIKERVSPGSSDTNKRCSWLSMRKAIDFPPLSICCMPSRPPAKLDQSFNLSERIPK